jgi:hypothetical protein
MPRKSPSPNTAASFSPSAIPATAGTIDFWAKLSGFSGEIPVSTGPHFFIYNHNLTNYSVGFTSNDGTGNNGLIGIAGRQFHTGSGGGTYEVYWVLEVRTHGITTP